MKIWYIIIIIIIMTKELVYNFWAPRSVFPAPLGTPKDTYKHYHSAIEVLSCKAASQHRTEMLSIVCHSSKMYINFDDCIVLYCIVLYCIVLYCIVLYCIVPYCIVLHFIQMCCIVLQCILMDYDIVLYEHMKPHKISH